MGGNKIKSISIAPKFTQPVSELVKGMKRNRWIIIWIRGMVRKSFTTSTVFSFNRATSTRATSENGLTISARWSISVQGDWIGSVVSGASGLPRSFSGIDVLAVEPVGNQEGNYLDNFAKLILIVPRWSRTRVIWIHKFKATFCP